MNSTVSTSVAAGGIGASVVVLLQWALGYAHISMPADVAAAAVVVLGALAHYLVALKVLPSGEAKAEADKPATPAA